MAGRACPNFGSDGPSLWPAERTLLGPVDHEHDGRVWVDDENPIFRRGLVSCVASAGFEVVGESARLIPEPSPGSFGVLIFDANPQQLRNAVRLVPDGQAKLVALVSAPAEQMVFDLLEAGVAAVLRRGDLRPTVLLAALEDAMAGNAAIPRGLMPRLLERISHGSASGGGLTEREMAVLHLLSEGRDTVEIAEKLCYSVRTVKNIVHDLLVKTNTRNRAHVVALAARQGLI
jgi:DNA-binding NarL/FixJ family response regulator